MYPIVHNAHIHPCGLVGLHTDAFSGDNASAHAEVLSTSVNTVFGDNERSGWHPVNGLCLAWPSATRVTDGRLPGHGSALLDRFEAALNETMQTNFWPSMSGGGLEQVGATVAVDELLLQSHEGFLNFFPVWPRDQGVPVSFSNLRARGAFVVSADLLGNGSIASPVSIMAEAGLPCRLLTPWPAETSHSPSFTVLAPDGATVPIVREKLLGEEIVWSFNTTKGSVFKLYRVFK